MPSCRSDGWRSLVPRRDNTGGEVVSPSANHPVSVPPTGPELCAALLCGRCTRWHALNVLMGSLSCCMVFLSTLRRPGGQLLRQRQSVFHVAASMADCCGSSNSGLVRRSDVATSYGFYLFSCKSLDVRVIRIMGRVGRIHASTSTIVYCRQRDGHQRQRAQQRWRRQ